MKYIVIIKHAHYPAYTITIEAPSLSIAREKAEDLLLEYEWISKIEEETND